MLDCAIALSLAEEDQNLPDVKSPNDAISVDRGTSPSHSDDLTCGFCDQIPLFPCNKRPKTFRVISSKTNADGPNSCLHYLAVSYCWPKDQDGNPVKYSTTYRVRTESESDGTTERKNRAPDYIIDDAVEYAAKHGINLIWIDQECLPQDNSREQELGVQGMDMVYQRALVSVALFDTVIDQQGQLDAVASVWNWDIKGDHLPMSIPLDNIKTHLVEFLELLACDPWNTRSWILQESFASDDHMVCLFKTKLSVPHMEPVDDDAFPYADAIPGSFCITLEDIERLIDMSSRFLLPILVDSSKESFQMSLEDQRASRVLERLKTLHPKPPLHNTSKTTVIQGYSYGPRKTCNAGTALTGLRNRSNFRVADRIVIMANICAYEIRLNTTELETRFKSLTECLFAQALMNGDLSLLNPEIYQSLSIFAPVNYYPSWMPQVTLPLTTIKYSQLRSSSDLSLHNPDFYHLSERGFSCPAYRWNVNRMVELTPISLKWRSSYVFLKTWSVERQPGETTEEARARLHIVEDKLNNRSERLGDPRYEENSNEWSPADDPTLTGIVDANEVGMSPRLQAQIGSIVLDILRHLYEKGERALANSIWHSFRYDALLLSEEKGETKVLPDDVGVLLKDEQLLKDPWALITLDRDQRDSFYQIWLLDRAVEKGYLWVGNYIDATGKSLAETSKVRGDGEWSWLDSLKNLLLLQNKDDRLGNRESIMQRQVSNQYLEGITRAALLTGKERKVPRERFDIYSSDLNSYTGGKEAEAERFQKVAVFNVDGPCVVATPFDNDREWLPRSKDRSMDVCWVIERVAESDEFWIDEEGHDSRSAALSQYRLLANVKGMWEIIETPSQRYSFI